MRYLILFFVMNAAFLATSNTSYSQTEDRWKPIGTLDNGTSVYMDTVSAVFADPESLSMGNVWIKINNELYFLEVLCKERRYNLTKGDEMIDLLKSIPPESYQEDILNYLCK